MAKKTPSTSSSGIGRALRKGAWASLLAAIAMGAIGLQLDRQARKDLKLASHVPRVFRHYASETLSKAAFLNGDAAAGLAYARDAALERPVGAEGLSLIARGLVAEGRNEEALAPLLLAAQRGWRDRYVQVTMAGAALQLNDSVTASQRLLAQWRTYNRDKVVRNLTWQLMETPKGPSDFAAALVPEETWAVDFLQGAADANVPGHAIEQVVAGFREKGIKTDCARLPALVSLMARTGRGEAAHYTWDTMCSSGQSTSSDDLAFTSEKDEVSSPFDWRYPSAAGLERHIAESDGQFTIDYTFKDYVAVPIAVNDTNLGAGRYKASLEVRAKGSTNAPFVTMALSCYALDGTERQILRNPVSGEAFEFEIPAKQCVGQRITLSVSHGQGEILGLHLDRLEGAQSR